MESAGAGGCRQREGRAGRCDYVCFAARRQIRAGCEANRAGKNGEKRAEVSGGEIEGQRQEIHGIVSVRRLFCRKPPQ